MSRQAITMMTAAVLLTSSAAFAQEPGAPKGWDDGSVTQQQPQRGNAFVFSAIGPGRGKGAVGLGGRVFIILPTFDINYARGFTDQFDFILNASTLGIITFADVGLRYRLVGDVDSGFSLGIKAAASPLLFFIAFGEGTAGAFGFGATPGLVASFGGRSVQFSLGLDFPMFFAGAGFATGGGDSATSSGSDFTPLFRPAATIEFGVTDTTNMYIQAQGWVPLEAGGFFGPIIAVGASW